MWCSAEATKLAKKIEKEITDHLSLLELSKGQDIVAVLGNTGSGKSTTLNWLAGKKLVVGPRRKILLEDESDPTAMAIGNKCEAMTKYPCSITISGLVFFDLPGFRDTGGMSCDLINSAFIKGILENAKSVRVLFFAGQDEVTGSRGELLKKLLDGVEELFDRESSVLNESSALVITKSEQESIPELFEFLKEEITPQYHKFLNGWQGKGRLFQVKKPHGKEISYDGREDIIKALSCSGQKVTHVNVNAIYPDCVDSELVKIFSCLLDEALASFMPKVDETKLSSLLEAIDKVKGDVETDNHSIGFWKLFEEHAEALSAVKVLKPLSEDSFEKAFETFQNNRIDTVKKTVASWEAKYEVLYCKIQKEFFERIDTVAKKELNKLRRNYSSGDITDISSGELKVKQLQDAQQTDVKKKVLETVNEDLEIKKIIERDPKSNRDVFEETRNRYKDTILDELEQDFMSEIEKTKDLTRSRIEGLKLQESVREKMSEVSRLSDKVEEERQAKERLNREIESMKSRSSDNDNSILLLLTALAQQNQARERSYAQGPIFVPELYERAPFESRSSSMLSSSSTSSSSSRTSTPRRMTWDQAHEMYSSGRYTQKEIAKKMGCSQPTVSRHFSKKK